VIGPDLGGLQHPEGLEPDNRPFGTDRDLGPLAQLIGAEVDRRSKRVPHARLDQSEGVADDDQAPGLRRRLARAEQDPSDPGEDLGIAGEPAGDVEARPERDGTAQRDAAMGGPDSQDAAVARWQPDRAAAVGAEREIDQASATAEADPFDEPPGIRRGSCGLTGVP
jgi:hypothetical protein